MNIIKYESLTSTNTLAKEMILQGVREGVITAETQTGGRGRMGRRFFSENGLFMTIILAPENMKIASEMLTSATAVALCRVLRARGLDVGIKWVNDLYFEEKKACGILAEAVSKGSTILGYAIGIGVNLEGAVFPEELHEIAVSLPIPLTERESLLQEILCEFEKVLTEDAEVLLAYLTTHSIVLGKPIRFFGATEGEGVAMGLDETGGLLVKTRDDALITLRTGEISVRVKNS